MIKNGKTEEEIKDIRSKHSHGSAMTLERCIKKYGVVKGTKIFNEWLSKHSERSNRNKEYWIKKGYSELEAKEIVKELQSTSTLEKFVKNMALKKARKNIKMLILEKLIALAALQDQCLS